jgi:flagellar protein FlaI
MFDLLRAALRSRPNYIIVGEIRGREGAVAFQAMQTGHPVLATFHASSVRKMIQRFTGDPINVPVTFIDNLNVVFIQQAVYRKGKFLRRCTSVEEIEGYFEEAGGVVTRAVFQWDSIDDVHIFRGMNNSYILENKIAERAGYEDKREIYDDLLLRAKILDEMVNREIFDYNQVNKIIRDFYDRGLEGIPFPI